jgi:Na+-transporting NADH:ubiquinone oxidoreductase subunit F
MIKTFNTTLTFKQQLTQNTVLFRFSLPQGESLDFKAGQYMMLQIEGKVRLYSIFSPNYIKDSFELFVKIVPNGLATTYLNNLKVGDQATFKGPAGLFVLRENPKGKVFLATVTGLAPMRSMILSYLKKSQNITPPNFYLFWGMSSTQDICLFDELKETEAEYQNFKLNICLSKEENLGNIKKEECRYFVLGRMNTGFDEFIKKELKGNVNEFVNNFDYYLCGSREVVESMRQYLYDKGVSKESVFFEKF